MQVVLGVSMTPTAVRVVLVEGAGGDGATVDASVFGVYPGDCAAERAAAAILGTRESVAAAGYRLSAVGVAWSDHVHAARLRDELRRRRVDDVVMVSELHGAAALAQAIGLRTGCARTALLFIERGTATLAVVRTTDRAVMWVASRSLHAPGEMAGIEASLAGLTCAELGGPDEPPRAVYVVGSAEDAEAVSTRIAEHTAVPVHAPDDGDLALARGAALAAAGSPRCEAATLALLPTHDTAGGDAPTAADVTQWGHQLPLGYSEVADDDDDRYPFESTEFADPEPKPFLLVGSALGVVFLTGVVALAISLTVSIRPAVEQLPGSVQNAPGTAAPQSPPPQTIRAPMPVVQEAPRTVYVPRPAVPPSASSAPYPSAAPVPAAPAPPAANPPVLPPAPAAPIPVVAPPLIVPAPQYPRSYPSNSAGIAAPQTSTQTSTRTTTQTTTQTFTQTTTQTATPTSTPAPPPPSEAPASTTPSEPPASTTPVAPTAAPTVIPTVTSSSTAEISMSLASG